MSKRLVKVLLYIGIVLSVARCAEDSGPTAIRPGRSISPFGMAITSHTRPSELALDQLARDVPGFGGMYSDSTGTLHIFLLDSLMAQNARSTISSFVQMTEGAVKPIRIHKGQFDILQLRSWQPAVDMLLSIEGVLSTDLDEASNRLRVTVMHPSALQAIENTLQQYGVPLDAVLVDLGYPAVPTATLSSTHRPLRGGNLVTGGGDDCTMGFNAVDSWDRDVFVVASHCAGADVGNGVTSMAFYQPTFVVWNFVGTEVLDPVLYSCLGGTKMCRWSDAALIEHDISSNSDLGRLHKTLSRDQYQGSTTINSSDPYFTIIEETPYASSSEIGDLVLNKIGWNTGWTNGHLVYTCVNKNVIGTNITLLCQDGVKAGSDGGDSGSPVFRKVGDSSADLYGIQWGKEFSTYYVDWIFWYSSMWNIESELAGLDTF